MTKRFLLAASEIKPLADGRGSCIASDRITVAGKGVGFMYRELPDDDLDSGWRFFSGEESQEYADDPANFALYDVNTIANYDPDIIAHLDAPIFSAFERNAEAGVFVSVGFPADWVRRRPPGRYIRGPSGCRQRARLLRPPKLKLVLRGSSSRQVVTILHQHG